MCGMQAATDLKTAAQLPTGVAEEQSENGVSLMIS